MSLNHLKISQNIIHPMMTISFIDFVLLLVLLVMSTTVFATPSGIQLKFPFEASQGQVDPVTTTIEITGENVIYVDNRVVTLNELRRFLASSDFRKKLIFIKSDRRSSMGRVADIFDLCRGIPGARINVSTSN
jgi:biopolymer transport protein ExbD